jgi:hypothetical protein
MIRVRHLVKAIGLAAILGACTVHGSGSMSVETTGEVYQEPPQPQVETVTVRPGFVWIKGRWNWTNGQWAWMGGHWERERAGYVWSEGRWERRGNRWVWVDGSWAVSSMPATATVTVVAPPPPTATVTVVAPPPPPPPGPVVRDHRGEGAVVVTGGAVGGTAVVTFGEYPTAAPPALQVENPGAKAGFVWITGRWDWRAGKGWEWVNGHWERPRANMVWVAGHWDLSGNRYIWVEGRWEAGAPPGPVVRDHRH